MQEAKSKKQWKEPTHVRYGDVVEITKSGRKGPGTTDGHGRDVTGSPGATG